MTFRNCARVAMLPLALAACAPSSQTVSPGTAPVTTATRTSHQISQADLQHRLDAVAHDSMIGRATGTIGHIKVTDHIAAEMRRLGLVPAGENGTYFQNVPFVQRTMTNATLSVDGQQLTVWQDFAPVHPGTAIRSYDNVPVVYGGIAQDTTKMLTREQAAGKVVILANRSANPALRGTFPGTRLEDAAAVLTVNSPNAFNVISNFFRTPGPTYVGGSLPTGERGVAMAISAEAATKLLGTALDTTMAPGTAGRTVRGSISFSEAPLVARNVVAALPGSDSNLKSTYVVIGSHSDHDPIRKEAVDHDSLRVFNAQVRARRIELGRNLTPAERAEIKVNVDSLRAIRPARLDSIMNGADDDGSGTVAMLEIAEAMAAASAKPKRSVLFVWHVAEELGLIGANHFTRNPTVARDSIIAALNIDMIGRGGAGEEPGGGPDYLQLIGWRRLSNQLGDVIEAVNQDRPMPFKFDLRYDAPGHPEQFYCRSDHYMYARFGIPVAFFTTGGHGDYHQVTDEPQYIDYAKLMNVTQLIHDVAVRVANLDTPPVVDGPKPDPEGQCKQ